jgi:hypothetical protein
MLKIGLDVSDGGKAAEDWLAELFGPALANMVALAASDEDARRLLKRIRQNGPTSIGRSAWRPKPSSASGKRKFGP